MSYKTALWSLVLISCALFAATKDFKHECLKIHNKFRKLHGAPELAIDDHLQTLAAEWAEHLLELKAIQRRSTNVYGENIFMTLGSDFSARKAVESWYNEKDDYDWSKPGYKGSTEHFTQVVWKSSLLLGCAIAKKDHTAFIVAYYHPPGNEAGEYPKNVISSKSAPTIEQHFVNKILAFNCIAQIVLNLNVF